METMERQSSRRTTQSLVALAFVSVGLMAWAATTFKPTSPRKLSSLLPRQLRSSSGDTPPSLAEVALEIVMERQGGGHSSSSSTYSRNHDLKDYVRHKSQNCPTYPKPPKLPGKKGVAMTFDDKTQPGSRFENLPKVQALNAYWNYRWGTERVNVQPEDMEFTPMVWGRNRISKYLTDLEPEIDVGLVERIMGFNEPDKPLQANMTVEEALELWPLLQEMNVSLISPSCAKPINPWMMEFMAAADLLCYRVDWIGVHWYGGVQFENFQRKMRRIYDYYRRPILITEMSPADWEAQTVEENRQSAADVLAFAKRALPWLERTHWVAGYAWFSFDPSRPHGVHATLFDENDNLTPLGEYYASVGPDNVWGDQTIQV